MSEGSTTVTLTPAAFATLQELLSLTGREPAAVLATAIERMAEEERVFAAKVALAREDLRTGRSASLDDAERRLRGTIEKAARRWA